MLLLKCKLFDFLKHAKIFSWGIHTIHKCNIIYTRETYFNSCLKIDDDSLQINKHKLIRLEQRPSAKGVMSVKYFND